MRTSIRWARWLVAFLMIAATTCNGGDGAVTSLDDFVDRAARAYCAWQFRCCVGVVAFNETSTTETGCVPYTRLALENLLGTDRASIASGRAAFSPAAAGA